MSILPLDRPLSGPHVKSLEALNTFVALGPDVRVAGVPFLWMHPPNCGFGPWDVKKDIYFCVTFI